MSMDGEDDVPNIVGSKSGLLEFTLMDYSPSVVVMQLEHFRFHKAFLY